MNDYIQVYEYEKNVNPPLSKNPITRVNVNKCDYGITVIDFSDVFRVEYKATSPNLLASFIKIKPGEYIQTKNQGDNNSINATSHLFFLINGSCEIIFDEDRLYGSPGDILISPMFNSLMVKNIGAEDLSIYYINDSPLVNYLGNRPVKKLFRPAVYTEEFLVTNLDNLSNPDNNRKGILLSNKDTEKIGTNTITPVLWALYNELPPNTVQRPHRHNSVALDLCISCEDNENIYTLMGEELDENGNIVNPTKIHWKTGEMFITPPGLWHSHNNTGETYAYILPIQDAGLLLYQRILGINLT
jgi:gentisate 1,2-dioxygenase